MYVTAVPHSLLCGLRGELTVLARLNENLPESAVRVWESQRCNLIKPTRPFSQSPESSSSVFLFPYSLLCAYISSLQKNESKQENICMKTIFSENVSWALIISTAQGILFMNWTYLHSLFSCSPPVFNTWHTLKWGFITAKLLCGTVKWT